MRGSMRNNQSCKDRGQIAVADFGLHIHSTCTTNALPHRRASGVVHSLLAPLSAQHAGQHMHSSVLQRSRADRPCGFRASHTWHLHNRCSAAQAHIWSGEGYSLGRCKLCFQSVICCANTTATAQLLPYVELTYRRSCDRLYRIVICIVWVDQHSVAETVRSVECTSQ